jgi:YVTN family beta-propeller protein
MRFSSMKMICAILAGVSWCQAAPNISMAKAKNIAIEAYPGKIESAELEQEKGRWVYSFDIRRAGEADIHETLVDANTGDIISQTTETPGQQATEKQTGTLFHLIKRTPVPGDGGWDYLTIDSAARLLYISHATQVQLFDLDQEKVVDSIPNTQGVHGIALAPELSRGFTSNGKDNSVAMFDLKTHRVLGTIPVEGQNPDTIVFDPTSKKVFTFNGKSNDATVIDPGSAKVIGHIALGGRPEFAVADGRGMLYDNLEDKSEVIAIDTKDLAIKHRWPVAPCDEPGSLAMDTEHRRLFIGCGNHMMAVLDPDNGHILAHVPIGDHVDATVFDAEKGLIFNANGDGTLTVVHQDDLDHYHVVDNVVTQKGARTVAFDSKTHHLYLVTAQVGPAEKATPEHPHPRPSIVPGTFTLLTVAATERSAHDTR